MKWVTLLVAPDSPKFAELGAAATDISVPSQWEPQVRFKPDFGLTAQDFTKAFSAKYGVEPGYHAAGGYAAGLILQHAIEQANALDPAKVAAALNNTDLTTMFGRTKFATDAEGPRSADRPRHGAGAMADEGRQADQGSDLAGRGQDRRHRHQLKDAACSGRTRSSA